MINMHPVVLEKMVVVGHNLDTEHLLMSYLKSLAKDTKPHIIKLKLMCISDSSNLSEVALIESRLGKILTDKICAYHRYTLGIEWKIVHQCVGMLAPSRKLLKHPIYLLLTELACLAILYFTEL